MRFSLIVAGTLAATVVAVPTASNHVLHEKRNYTPEQWVKRSKLHSRALLPMRIGMTQSNLHKGHDLLMDVSKHDSPNYGKYYTAEEINELFAPHDDTVSAIREWLESAGISADAISQSANKQWMQFDATSEEAEALLKTEFHLYEHADTGKTNVACDEYHVPSHIKQHVDYITPGIRLFAPEGKTKMPTVEKRNNYKKEPLIKDLPISIAELLAQPAATGCDTSMTPSCIATMYNITAGTKKATGNQLGIFETIADVYAQQDLDLFFQNLASNIPTGTAPVLDSVDGATAPNPVASAGPESDLDFQISYPIIYPQGSILYQSDDDYYQSHYTYAGFFNNFLDAIDGSYCTYSAYGETGNSNIDPPYPDPNTGGYKGQLECGVYKPTNVISISYGGTEYSLPASYQERQCNEWMKLGMQGVSVVVASGDSGVAGARFSSGINGCLGTTHTIFNPDFPATCPYLTTVGATYLPTGANVNADAEVAVTRFASGGGFSNIYGIPSYQSSAVSTYFATAKPTYPYYSGLNYTNFGANGGIYNRIGRGYPDVGAVGDNVVIYNKGKAVTIGGTSASAPCFAAILTRINEERLAVGKSTVGFVNPTLYANPSILHDITTGSNPGCGTNGFSVAKGWDPVTGLGTPNYPAMLSLFMSLA